MAESTLVLALDDLAGEVGQFLGFGRGAPRGDPAWTTSQQAAITSCVASGLRQFYWPPPLDQAGSYDWSFLKPVATLSLASGVMTVPLPDDFGGFEGRISVTQSGQSSFWPVELTGVGSIYEQAARYPYTTGRPQMVCEEPLKGTTALGGQRFQLRFWPTPDANYAIQFAYYVLPDYLTGAFPFAYGGAAHIETILESCLAIAEQRLDDASAVHSAKFQERLAASVSLDRRNKPQVLGYNRDRSDERSRFGERDWRSFPGITIQGIQY